MQITRLVLMLTEDCNFSCKYCYQTREKKYMDWQTAKKAQSFFLLSQNPSDNYHLFFLGGEPLLAFDLIKKSVSFLESKNKELKLNGTYGISTNGSLISSEVLEFFDKHRFIVELSFDGYAQDIGRKKGTYDKTVSLIKEILKFPNISLQTNSVFTPKTIAHLAKSIESIVELGAPEIHLSFSLTNRWNKSSLQKMATELAKLREILTCHYRATGSLPVTFFSETEEKGVWQCPGGYNTMSISPDGKVWGCPLFHEHFKGKEYSDEYNKYFFGNLQNFIENHEEYYPGIAANYEWFRMDNLWTTHAQCTNCPDVEKCSVCTTDVLPGKVPNFICKINKIKIKENNRFRKEIKTLKSN